MSATGYYELRLVCDEKKCLMSDTFTMPTRMHAKQAALEAGWLITKYNKSLCPEHAAIRRAS